MDSQGDSQALDAPLLDAPTLCDSTAQSGGWAIRRSGKQLNVIAAGRFQLTIHLDETSPYGWRVLEANPIRLRLHRDARPADWTIYEDGRQYLDGRWGGSWIRQDAMSVRYAAAHRNPAQIVTPPEQGKLLRDTPGDTHNDGYNELRGSYELRAMAARIEARITPGAAPLARPVFEIIGLPPGRIVAIADGTLIAQTFRARNGLVLVEFPPGLIDRTITLSVSAVGP